MSYKLSGISPLAYMGVEPSTPPQMLVLPRQPFPTDSVGYNLGTYWLVAAPPPTMNWELWILVDLTAGVATWIQLYPGNNIGTAKQFDEDVGIAIPALGIINVLGGANMNTFGSGNTIIINLNETIHWPTTTSDGLVGAIYLGGTNGAGGYLFMHNYGDFNTWLGQNAGNLTLTVATADNNTGIGYLALNSVVSAGLNTAVGSGALSSLTSGAGNSAFGDGALTAITGSASDNTCIGVNAGVNYLTTESNNILINNEGVLGESDTIRIGVEGTQTAAYMAGIYNEPIGTPNGVVYVDSTGKLGTGSPVPPPPIPIPPYADGFMYIQPTTSGSVTGNGATYGMGSAVALTSVYDFSGGSFFPGDGAGTPCKFTAPLTGLWSFNVQIEAISGFSIAVLQPLIYVVTPAHTFYNIFDGRLAAGTAGLFCNATASPSNVPNIPFNVVTPLTAGDTVFFNIALGSASFPKTTTILGNANPITWISGYFIAYA